MRTLSASQLMFAQETLSSMLQKALTDQKKEKERIENMSDPNSKQV